MKNITIKFSVKNNFLLSVLLCALTPRQSKHLKVKVAHVAVALFLPRSNNFLKAVCGTKSATTALNVTDHWTRCLLAMGQTRIFIAKLVMENVLVLKDLAMDTHQPWCRLPVNPQSICKLISLI